MLLDRRLWAIAVAYCLVFTLYVLWANWTTVYLVQERRLTQLEANARFAWIPPAFAMLGGFLGSGLAFIFIRRGMQGLAARMRVCWCLSPLLLAGVALQLMPNTTLAAAAIGISLLTFQAMLGSLFLMPLDLFGARPAGISSSMLGFLAASTQVLVSPAIGAIVDRLGFTLLSVVSPLLPFIGLAILQATLHATLRAKPAAPLPAPAR